MMRRCVVYGLFGCMLMLSQGCGSQGDDGAGSSTGSSPPQAVDPKAGEVITPAATTQGASVAENPDPVESLNPTPVVEALSLSLLDAAQQGNIGAVRDAIARGESINLGDDKFGNTPVMFAAMSDCVPCIRLLLDAGAQLEFRNTSQATALMWAAMQASSATVKFLIDNGADVYAETPSGKNPLSLANARKEDTHKAMIIVLLEMAQRNP